MSLLVQLVASFGHFHAEDFRFPIAGLAAGNPWAATSLPGDGQPTLPSHDDCAICLNLQMAGSSALPQPLALAAPAEVGEVPLAASLELRLTPPPHLLFQTRGPPLA